MRKQIKEGAQIQTAPVITANEIFGSTIRQVLLRDLQSKKCNQPAPAIKVNQAKLKDSCSWNEAWELICHKRFSLILEENLEFILSTGGERMHISIPINYEHPSILHALLISRILRSDPLNTQILLGTFGRDGDLSLGEWGFREDLKAICAIDYPDDQQISMDDSQLDALKKFRGFILHIFGYHSEQMTFSIESYETMQALFIKLESQQKIYQRVKAYHELFQALPSPYRGLQTKSARNGGHYS
jgi:hypothetical protein